MSYAQPVYEVCRDRTINGGCGTAHWVRYLMIPYFALLLICALAISVLLVYFLVALFRELDR